MKRRVIIDLVTEVEENESPSLLYDDIRQELCCCWHDVSFTMKHEDVDEPQKKEVEWVYNKRERLWYPYSNGELLFKDEPQTDCDRYVITNDEGERAYNCIGCQTDCAWMKGE